MTWATHIAFGSIVASVFGLHTFLVMLGSTAPDWLEDLFGLREHRGVSHYVFLWGVAFLVSLFLLLYFGGWALWLFSFVVGGCSHILLDALTVAGVPLGFGKMRVRIGGLIRTGKQSEWVFLVLLLVAFVPLKGLNLEIGYSKWKGYYEKGLLDEREFLERKFKLF